MRWRCSTAAASTSPPIPGSIDPPAPRRRGRAATAVAAPEAAATRRTARADRGALAVPRNPADAIADFLESNGADKRRLTFAAQTALAKLGFRSSRPAPSTRRRAKRCVEFEKKRHMPASTEITAKLVQDLNAAERRPIDLRLRTDIWVSAYMRTIEVGGGFATLRRRGAAEAGAVLRRARSVSTAAARCSRRAQRRSLERRFVRAHKAEWVDSPEISARLAREIKRDPDIWIVDVERRDGAHGLDVA